MSGSKLFRKSGIQDSSKSIASIVLRNSGSASITHSRLPALVKDFQIQRNKLKNAGIDIKIIQDAKTKITINTKIITSEGDTTSSSTEASIGIGFITGILIYMFIFMYGTMVMRGVIEEKTNRIVEIIISSVKPFQLMIGKILGVALVGLTQFILWVCLTILISSIAETMFVSSEEISNSINSADQDFLTNYHLDMKT